MQQQTLTVTVYRSAKKNDTYLYLPAQDDFSELPEALQKQFGQPTFVMELELTAETSLARFDAKDLMAALNETGYVLQLPPPLLDHGLHERLTE